MKSRTVSSIMVSELEQNIMEIFRLHLIVFRRTGMQPVLFSSLSGSWSRVGKDILYYRSNTVFSRTKSGSPCDSNSSGEAAAGGTTVRQKSGKREASKTTKRFYTLTFTVTFPHNQDTCCLAYHFPYTYTMLRVSS